MSGDPRLPLWPVVAGLLLLLMALVLAPALAFLLTARGAAGPMTQLLATVSLYAVVLLVLTAAGAAFRRESLKSRLRLSRPRLSAVGIAVAVAGVLALGELLSAMIHLSGRGESGSLARLDEVMARASGPQLLAAVLLMGLLGGTAEELFFRGFMQTALVRRLGRAAGIGLTALAFGIVHLDPVHAPAAFVVGLLLGWLAERSGSIWPGVVAHVVNNAVAVVLPSVLPQPVPPALYVAELVVMPVILLGCLVWLDRTLPREEDAG